MNNNALLNAISKYIYNKDEKSFEINVIKLLVIIYNEIDLINPYLIQDYALIDTNLQKYGLSKEELEKFKSSFSSYMIKNDMNSLLTTYKIIIDMIVKKHKDDFILEEEVKKYEAIFFAGRSIKSLEEYWNKALYKINHKISLNKINDNVFNPYIYYLQGKTMADIKEMSNQDLFKLNEKILKKYNLNINDNNLKGKLNKIVNKAMNPIGPLTSGNGFVDIIMILSFVATEILVGAIIALQLLKR